MDNEIKIAFFDIDWTLYDHKNKNWSYPSLDAIKKLKEKGIKVFICSARPLPSLKQFGVFDLGVDWDGVICSSGAAALVGQKIIRKQVMNKKDARKIVSICKKNKITVQFETMKGRYWIGRANEFTDAYFKIFREPKCPRRHVLIGQEIIGFIIFCKEDKDYLFKNVIDPISFYRFSDVSVDLSNVIHEKGLAIEDVLKHYGFTKENAISFGDDFQDISMAEHSGYFVCMGNGRDEVKKVANMITEEVWNDGVKTALDHLNLI